MESENETQSAEEYSYDSIEEWREDNISWKLEEFMSVFGVPIEWYNPQSVGEITELIFWLAKIKIPSHMH